jgi:hypothetical protein
MSGADETDAGIERIAATVESYLVRHPNASDTIEGILRWWLGGASFDEEDTRLVEPALERLIARGLMTKRLLPGGGVVFAGRGTRAARDSAPRPDEETR